MARIINFPPQPGKFEEIEDTWFYEGSTCKANGGEPDANARKCPLFVKKYPHDTVTPDHCYCLMCQHFSVPED